jgi:hypothetical protein
MVRVGFQSRSSIVNRREDRSAGMETKYGEQTGLLDRGRDFGMGGVVKERPVALIRGRDCS